MQTREALEELERLGNARTLAELRHKGASGDAFGVPTRDLEELADRAGRDDALARGLWASGIVDARILAIRVADPVALSAEDLDAWAHDVTYYPLLDRLSGLVASTPHALGLVDRWVRSEHEYVARCGFLTMAELAKKEREIEDRELASKLETIEEHVRTSTSRAKEELGQALVTIGQRNDRLQQLALDVARRIGKIEIEHPELGRIESDAVELLRNPELAAKLLDGDG